MKTKLNKVRDFQKIGEQIINDKPTVNDFKDCGLRYDLFPYVVENVIPYYEPLIQAKKRGRHLYWTNFNLPNDLNERKSSIMEAKDEVNKWCEFHDYDFTQYKGTQRTDKIARNLVDYEAGKTIFQTFLGIENKSNEKQTSIFDII